MVKQHSKLYYLVNKNRLSMVVWVAIVSLLIHSIFILIGWYPFTIWVILTAIARGAVLGLIFFAIQKKKGISINKDVDATTQE